MLIRKMMLLMLMCLSFVASHAHAELLKFTYTGPTFDMAYGSFTNAHRITGWVSFDKSLLSEDGIGFLGSSSFGVDPRISWEFTDGINYFSNLVTTNNFSMEFHLAQFRMTYWNIDTTWGVTEMSDIFVHSGMGRYESFAPGSFAQSWFTPSSSQWVMTTDAPADVNGPSFAAFMGLLALGFGAVQRRKAAHRNNNK